MDHHRRADAHVWAIVVIVFVGLVSLIAIPIMLGRSRAFTTWGEPARFELVQGEGDSILRIWRDRQTGRTYLIPSKGGVVEIEPMSATVER